MASFAVAARKQIVQAVIYRVTRTCLARGLPLSIGGPGLRQLHAQLLGQLPLQLLFSLHGQLARGLHVPPRAYAWHRDLSRKRDRAIKRKRGNDEGSAFEA